MITNDTKKTGNYETDTPSAAASREERQWEALRGLLRTVFEHNPFYQEKWKAAGLESWRDIASMDDFRRLPFTTRAELSQDQEAHPPYGTNLTWPLEKYIKWYRTSGTSGKPLVILVTAQDHLADAHGWQVLYTDVGLRPGDSIYVISSFGPFRAYWSGVAGAEEFGLLMIPGGGQTTLQRIQFILQHRPVAVRCIPSYWQRMIEVAQENHIDLQAAGLRVMITGGEPGASIPSVRTRLEQAWNAELFDGVGMSEVGHFAHECRVHAGLHLQEDSFLAEVLEPGGSEPVPAGETGELVLTPLNRDGMPVVRYRTNDLVRLSTEPCACGSHSARLLGGILSRADGMITVRGINIYPTALAALLMSHPEVVEYRVEIFERRGMKELRVLVETEADPASSQARVVVERIVQDLRQKLYLRAEVETVAYGSLPRLEGKAKRFVNIR